MSKRGKKSKPQRDTRMDLADLERTMRADKRTAEKLREAIYSDYAQTEKMPEAGSQWRKHPGFLMQHEPDYVWTYTFLAWGDPHREPSKQYAVVERQAEKGETARRVVEMQAFIVEYVRVDGGARKKGSGS
jgi:hypothetical protein